MWLPCAIRPREKLLYTQIIVARQSRRFPFFPSMLCVRCRAILGAFCFAAAAQLLLLLLLLLWTRAVTASNHVLLLPDIK